MESEGDAVIIPDGGKEEALSESSKKKQSLKKFEEV